MNRGGKRPGAGRKMLSDTPRVTLSIRVSTKTKTILDQVRRAGLSAGQLVDALVQDYATLHDMDF